MLSHPIRMEGPPSSQSHTGTSLSPQAVELPAPLLGSILTLVVEQGCCLPAKGRDTLSFHLLALLGFGSLHVFTQSDGSRDLSPWKQLEPEKG